jgi:ATPase subunit of ABC transporter with duplicated ATPase domains
MKKWPVKKRERKRAKLELWIPNGPRLGDKVIEVKNVSKAFGDRILFENLNLDIPKMPSSASSDLTVWVNLRCSKC